MSEALKLYLIPTSPNYLKVRIALKLKGLAYEGIKVDPSDRSGVINASGQPLTPVLVHGDRAIFDSAAIMRYLECNCRDTRPLFSTDVAEMNAIDEWELFARGALLEPLEIAIAEEERRDAGALAKASALLLTRTARLEERLGKSDWLVGDRITAADISAGVMVRYYYMTPEEDAGEGGFTEILCRYLRLGHDRARTRAWAERVVAAGK